MMCHDDINFAAFKIAVSYPINYLLTASMGGGTFYREVIKESRDKRSPLYYFTIRPWRVKTVSD
jgi:hypothetical protein